MFKYECCLMSGLRDINFCKKKKKIHISIALCDANADGWLNAKALYQFSDILSDRLFDMNCTFILKT